MGYKTHNAYTMSHKQGRHQTHGSNSVKS